MAPLVIWDPALLGYRLSATHPLNPVRLDLTIALATELGVLDGIELTRPQPASDEVLWRVHTRDYIEAVKAASVPGSDAAYWPDDGYGLGTVDNPVFAGMHDASALIAGGSVAAAAAIADGTVDRAVNIAGGLHHAMAARASGFCVYNDCALAITELLRLGVERVAYVDVDVHHGDGVQAAFYQDPRVLTVSIHESPLTLWPGTGLPAETGAGAGAGTAVNIPVPAGSSDRSWLRAFQAVVPGVVRAFRPQVLVSQHGADTHREDPLADLALSVDGQRAAQLAIRGLAAELTGGRWLALGGGGYSLVRVVPRTWTHLLAIVLDRDVDPRTALPPGFRRRAAELLRDDGSLAGVLPAAMTDGADVDFAPWDGQAETPVDRAILAARTEVYPLFGLDPRDPRD
jgi:acetoin utilization protein AcuC